MVESRVVEQVGSQWSGPTVLCGSYITAHSAVEMAQVGALSPRTSPSAHPGLCVCFSLGSQHVCCLGCYHTPFNASLAPAQKPN